MKTVPRKLPPRPEGSRGTAEDCSVLGALDVVGDYWTLAILRSATFGLRRFGQFEAELGLASNVLGDRLQRLVEAGLMERARYCERPPRDEYLLTPAGRELTPVVLALKNWGDRHVRRGGPASVVHHASCSAALEVVARCPDCDSVAPADGIAVRRA